MSPLVPGYQPYLTDFCVELGEALADVSNSLDFDLVPADVAQAVHDLTIACRSLAEVVGEHMEQEMERWNREGLG